MAAAPMADAMDAQTILRFDMEIPSFPVPVNLAAWTDKSALADQCYRVSCAISLQARLGQTTTPNTALDCKMGKDSVAAAPAFRNQDTVLPGEAVQDPTAGQEALAAVREDCPAAQAEGLEDHRRRLHHHHRRRRPRHSRRRFLSIQNHTRMFQWQALSSCRLSSPWKVHISNAPL